MNYRPQFYIPLSWIKLSLIYCRFPGLAALAQSYVQAICSPEGIPNVQDAWETFVGNKCSEAVKGALENYENVMKSKLKNKLPCGNDELRKVHGTASITSQAYFMAETAEISTSTTETYLKKLLFTVRQVVVIYYNVWGIFGVRDKRALKKMALLAENRVIS